MGRSQSLYWPTQQKRGAMDGKEITRPGGKSLCKLSGRLFVSVSCPKVSVTSVQCPDVHGHTASHIWVIFQVEPFASLSEAVQKSVPRLLINRDLVGPFVLSPRRKDVVQLGDVVHGVERLVDLLGWTQELLDLMQRERGKVQWLWPVRQSASSLVTALSAWLAFRSVVPLQTIAFASYSTALCWDMVLGPRGGEGLRS